MRTLQAARRADGPERIPEGSDQFRFKTGWASFFFSTYLMPGSVM